jgi:tetratricopeptide (TPR) repeat protein
MALDGLGRRSEWLAACETAAAVAEAAGDMHTLTHVLPLIAWGHVDRGSAEGCRLLERAVAVAERYGHPVHLAHALAHDGACALGRGDWTRARASCERALALSRRAGDSWQSTYALLEIGRLSLREGRLAEATAYLEEGASAARRTGNLDAQRAAQRGLAEIDLLEGRPAAARDRLVGLLDRPGLVESEVSYLLPVLAWALVELGDLEQADSLAGEAVRRVRPEGVRFVLADALVVQARVRLRRGAWPEARASLDEGLAVARAIPRPHTEALLLQVDGELCLRMGQPEAARERLDAARALFERLGAQEDERRTTALLASLSSKPSAL